MNNFRHWRSQIRDNFSFMTKTACHRKRITLELPWRIQKHHHRSGLICDEKQTVIELFSHACRGLPHWWALPLKMLSTCTCYSRLHWWWFGMCHLLIAQRGHLWFLHVSGSSWTTCRVPIVPHVSFLLAHVSCCGWIMCHFFIGPCVVFLLVHMAVSYSTTSHGPVYPYFIFLFGHVAWWLPSTCPI
jgi:hypothetical protein